MQEERNFICSTINSKLSAHMPTRASWLLYTVMDNRTTSPYSAKTIPAGGMDMGRRRNAEPLPNQMPTAQEPDSAAIICRKANLSSASPRADEQAKRALMSSNISTAAAPPDAHCPWSTSTSGTYVQCLHYPTCGILMLKGIGVKHQQSARPWGRYFHDYPKDWIVFE